MEVLLNDIRVAGRRLVRDPLFFVIAVLTLAIGIGANSAIFTLVNGVLLRPLPFTDPDELVQFQVIVEGQRHGIASPAVFRALRDHGTAFSGAALSTQTGGTLTGAGEPQVLSGAAISANYFDVVGVAPALGRLFRADENEPGRTAVVLLSEGLWRGRFGGDAGIVGRTVLINDVAREVVGVMPASASFPPELEYWVPFGYTPQFNSPNAVYGLYLDVVARLLPGVTLAQAEVDAARVMEIAKQEADRQVPTWTAGVQPLHDRFISEARRPLLLLLGAVGLVLLIACANLANLLLAQAAARSTDFAVRRALGASPSRLIRQLAVESLVLGIAGGVTGLLFGAWAVDALVALMPQDMPRIADITLDGTVIAFTLGVSIVSALLFGIAPVAHARRSAPAPALREGGRGLAGRSGARTRSALVLAETAIAFALVIGAGLLIRSFDQLRRVDPGFSADNTLTFDLLLPPSRYADGEHIAAFWDRLGDRLRAIPGVTAVGAINDLPLGGAGLINNFEVSGRAEPPAGADQTMTVLVTTPGFFEAMGVPLRAGRTFDTGDRAGAPRVALLSEAAVERHFPGENPIGRHIVMGLTVDGTRVEGEVVGVVGSIRHGQLREAAEPEIYFASAQVPMRALSTTVATSVEPATLRDAVRAAVAELDPSLAPARMQLMSDVVAASVATDRFMTRLLTAFSVVALLLAAIGIFGVVSYGVTQRRREIGVRMAVGASRADVVRMIVSGALRLAGGGVILGVAGAMVSARLLQSLLFGVGAFDPLTFISAGLVLLSVATLASLVPAWRASTTPPAAVLNTD